jgi:hypothetical protein
MVDILLIQPPIHDFYLTKKRTLPYGLTGIAAVLMQDGFSVEMLDGLATPKSRCIEWPVEMQYLEKFYGQPDVSPFGLFHQYRHYGYSYEFIENRIRQAKPVMVGISSLFTAYSDQAHRVSDIVKRIFPGCPTVFGGHHPTAMPESVMSSLSVDFVLRGEGEVSMPLLARALKTGTGVEKIPGICFRRPDGTLHISKPAVMAVPDQFPLPAFHLVKHGFYSRRKRPGTVIVTSRGCPRQCTYCCMGSASWNRYRQRSVKSVMQEIENAVVHYNAGFIDFEDENISLNKGWFLELLHQIRSEFGGVDLELRAMNGLFPPSLDAEVVSAMEKSGFKTLNLSLATIDKVQLEKFKRPDVTRSFKQALDLAVNHNMDAVGYIIAGAPGQKAVDTISDLVFLAGQKVLAGLSVYYPAPDSADFALCEKRGLLPPSPMLMRSTALPLSDTTTRLQSATVLRLSRIVNFMKALMGQGIAIPSSKAFCPEALPDDRLIAGQRVLQWFLHDGRIRGITPEGQVYAHTIDENLSRLFIQRLQLPSGWRVAAP